MKKTVVYRTLGKLLFVLYLGFVFYFLLLSEAYGRRGEMTEYHYNLELFKEIKRFWQYREQLGWFATTANLVGNVLVFVPFGFLMPMASKERSLIATVCYSFVLSLVVEISQILLKVGSFDVDDLLLNTVGGILGYIAFLICNALRRNYARKRNR